LPKFVGSPQKGHTKTVYELVTADTLNDFPAGSTVDTWTLCEMGLTTKANKGRDLYKVVAGEVALVVPNLIVRAHAFTASAREEIEKQGGTCVVMSRTKEIPLDQAQAEKAVIKASNLVKLKALRKLKAQRMTA
jgi:ribosomal protein L15